MDCRLISTKPNYLNQCWYRYCILSVGPLGINFSEISMEIQTFSFKKMRLKVSSAKWWPFCFSLDVLKYSLFSWKQCPWMWKGILQFQLGHDHMCLLCQCLILAHCSICLQLQCSVHQTHGSVWLLHHHSYGSNLFTSGSGFPVHTSVPLLMSWQRNPMRALSILLEVSEPCKW